MCFVQYSLTGLTVASQRVVTIQNHLLLHEVFPYFCYSFSFSASNFHHQLHNSFNLNVIHFSHLWILTLSCCVGWLHYFLVPTKNLNLSTSYAITLMQNSCQSYSSWSMLVLSAIFMSFYLVNFCVTLLHFPISFMLFICLIITNHLSLITV
jgi:hypothetical protein